METLKELLAFPLYATAIWLLWVAGRQTGVNTMATALAVTSTAWMLHHALAGLTQESMMLGQGWHFLQMGRRMERTLQILRADRVVIAVTNIVLSRP